MNPAEYEATVAVITTALRDAIGAHGPISKRYSRSAAKLVAHALATQQEPPRES